MLQLHTSSAHSGPPDLRATETVHYTVVSDLLSLALEAILVLLVINKWLCMGDN